MMCRTSTAGFFFSWRSPVLFPDTSRLAFAIQNPDRIVWHEWESSRYS